MNNNDSKALITILYFKSEINNIYDHIREKFKGFLKEVTEDSNKMVLKYFDDSTDYYIVRKDGIKEQIQGMCNFYSNAMNKNGNFIDGIINQINLLDSMMYFYITDLSSNVKYNQIMNLLFSIIENKCGFLIMPNLTIYDSTRKKLITAEGISDYTEYYAKAPVKEVFKEKQVFSDLDIQIKNKNIGLLKQNGIQVFEDMINVPLENNTILKNKDDILKEFLIQYIISTLSSESLSGNDPNIIINVMKEKFINKYGITELVNSNQIINLLLDKKLTQQEMMNLTWRFERCKPFAWALKIIEDFNFDFKTEFNISTIDDMLFNGSTIIENCSLRDKLEILEKAELLNRINWACEEARINKTSIDNVNEGIVIEQLKAFEFMLSWRKK